MPPGREYVPSGTFRTADCSCNMVRVGDELAAALSAYGISVVHDRTLHDGQSYNDAYENSLASIQSYLAKYPSIVYVLDLHRDAVQDANGTQYKLVTAEDPAAAQVSLIMGVAHDGWQDNLRLAIAVQEKLIEKIRSEYDDLAVVCYINSTAELKRHSDVCVTSSNAVKIVKALPNKNIFFIPDRNLAHYIAGLVPEKNFIYNEGFCIVHEYMEVEEIQEAKAAHPEAEVLSHPECPAKVLELSDFVGSTSEIIAQAGKSDAKEFIICTESGVLYELQKRNPEKKFYFTETTPICRNMKKVTLEKVLHVLKTGENEVFVDDKLREESKKPLERMLELAK